jgi:Tol biopolymer transport system component
MSSVDWVPDLAAALDGLVPVEDGSSADWDNVVGRVGGRHSGWFERRRPRRSLRLAIVIALLFLLLTGVATATYLLVRGDGGIALGGGSRLLMTDPNGHGLRKVAGCVTGDRSCTVFEPAWSPDGTRIAFTRGIYGGPRERSRMFVSVAAIHGGTVTRLAACGLCGEQDGGQLGWSPDGKWIAFSRDTGLSGQESLWIVAADGGRARQLTHCSAPCVDIEPRWSPNGDVLLFQRISSGDGNQVSNTLYTVRPEGSRLTRIGSGADPQWSPDGRRIVFDGANSIEVANADGSNAHVVVAGATSGTAPGAASWSPNGQKLVFFKTPGTRGHFTAEVWTMNTDGADKKLLYRSGCCVSVWTPPIWSPDGQQIAFSADSAGGTFVINADGTGLQQINRGTYELSWQSTPQH